MKRDPMDYTLRDIEESIATVHGVALDQIMALDFPPADYLDGDEPVWRLETVYAWLQVFHAAMYVSGAAADPEGAKALADTMRELMQARNQAESFPRSTQEHVAALDRYSAFNFANLAGYKSMEAFEADRRAGIIPPHDGIDGNGFPYWRRASIEKFKGGQP